MSAFTDAVIWPANIGNSMRIATLDGARGLAAVTVLVSHAANEHLLPSVLGHGLGRVAVGLFFILSGFLMAHLYGHLPVTSFQVRRYAAHRFGRVVPLYIAVVVISWLLFDRAGSFWVYPINGLDALATHIAFIMGYKTLWTIPVEVQFYAVFVLLWFMQFRQLLIPGLAIVVALSFTALIFMTLEKSGTTFLPFWMHYFLMGAMIGFYLDRFDWLKRLPNWVAWLAVPVLVIAIFGARLKVVTDTFAVYDNPVIIGALLAFFALSLSAAGPFIVLATPVARWFGSISYSFYLFHLPILLTLCAFFHATNPASGMMIFAAAFALTTLSAWLSFRYFETPARRFIAVAGRVS